MRPVRHALRKASTLIPSICCLVLVVAITSSCGDDKVVQPKPDDSSDFTVSGTIVNPESIPISTTTKVVVVWNVSTGDPDYLYVVKADALAPNGTEFTLTLPEFLPDAACNARGISLSDSNYMRCGVGLIMVIDDPKALFQAGTKMEGLDGLSGDYRVLGAVDNSAVIYRRGLTKAVKDWREWLELFTPGYGLGRGFSVSGQKAGFAPYSPGERPVLRVDTTYKYTFPNWT